MVNNADGVGKRPVYALAKLCLVLLVFASIYPALYFLFLDPEEDIQGNLDRVVSWRVPAYRIGGARLAPLFAPMNYVDRAMRPGYWAEREVSEDELINLRIEGIPVPEPIDPEKAAR